VSCETHIERGHIARADAIFAMPIGLANKKNFSRATLIWNAYKQEFSDSFELLYLSSTVQIRFRLVRLFRAPLQLIEI
jgi:hypothetical protein